MLTFFFFFLFSFFLHLISPQDNPCNTIQPKSKYDCLKFSANTSYCCFISSLLDPKVEKCFFYQDFRDYKGSSQIVYNSVRYEIDCGLGSTYMDSDWNMTIESRYPCGSEHPNNENDCFQGSTKENSCCYYEGHGLKNCYNLGIKFEGKTTEDGYTFICFSYTLNKKNVFIYNIIILMFFIM